MARLQRLSCLTLLGLALVWGSLTWAAPPKEDMPLARVVFGQHQVLAEVPLSPTQRVKGLGGRRALKPGQGMLFIFSDQAPGMCMRDMHFPLDFIWLNQGKVGQINPGVPAHGERVSVRAKSPAQMVLEVPAGWARKRGIHVGQEVKVTMVSGELPDYLARVIGADRP